MSQPHFSEKQYMRQWWLQLILAMPIILFLWAFVQQVVMGQPFGGQPMSDFSLLMMGGLIFGLSALLWYSNLKTDFFNDRLEYQFYPFQWKRQTIQWAEVKKATLIRYRPIKDYGGWGLRMSTKNGRAYNVSGNIGVKLEMKDGKPILFGTQKPDEIKRVFANVKVPFEDQL